MRAQRYISGLIAALEDPGVAGRGREARMADAADAIVRGVDGTALPPDEEADGRMIAGRMYELLGMHPESIAQYERALALRTARFGDTSPEALETLSALARAVAAQRTELLATGKFLDDEESAQAVAAAFRALVASLGWRDPRTLDAFAWSAPALRPDEVRRVLAQIGGDAADIERVRPVLACMGNQFFICGGQGMGHAMKMTNNLLATTIMCANTEALAIGAKCGLTLETMVEVMKTTMGWNQQLAVALPKKAFLGDDSPGFMVKLAAKDVRLAVAQARQQGFEPMVGAGALATLDRAAQLGRADRDTAALLFLREEELGIRVRPVAAPAAA